MSGITGIAGTGRVAPTFVSNLRQAQISVRYHAGADAAPNRAGEFVSGLRTLLLAPRDIAEAEELLFEREAFAKSAPTLECIAICAVLSPRYVSALRARIPQRIALIDAPYGGGLRAAEEARLTFYLGGPQSEVERLSPLFGHLGRKSIRVGGFGTAMAAKVMNDFMAASRNAMTRIAVEFAEAHGIDEERLLEIAEQPEPADDMPDLVDSVVMPPNAMCGGECISDLVRNVETAFGTALANAHLAPHRVAVRAPRHTRSRPLH